MTEMKNNESSNWDSERGSVDIPNEETLAALLETDCEIRHGSIKRFSGSTKDFFKEILTDKG